MMLQTAELPFITKIIIPKRRDYMVRRDRLLEPLKAGISKKVQVLCAPAGYGKTELLVEFASASGLPICWYSFTPEDSDPVSFLRYCLQSIRTRFASFGADSRSLLRGSLNGDWRSQFGFFISALQSDIGGPLIFVFDDLHWIAGKRELEEALSLLIERAPASVHFVLGSRVRPSLACLPKLAVQDELGSLDANDLRFSTEETIQLLNRLWQRPVAAKEADEVNDRTGGWAAAIVLTAKSQTTRTSPDPSKLQDEGLLFHYLSEEVLNKLPESLQSFLQQTSILREFTVALCDRLLGLSCSEARINQVKDRGLFLAERAAGGTAFAYHDLFRQYLESRFRSEHPEEYKCLNLRAATLYSELGDDDAAIYHSLQGGAWDKAIDLVKRGSRVYFDQGRWQKLDSWLTRLPQEAVERDPDLLLLKGQVLLRLGDPTGSLAQLDKLVSGPGAKDQAARGKALVAKSTAYRRLGHLDLAAKAAEDGLSALRGTHCSQDDLAEGYKQLGDAFSMQGEYDRAKQNLQAALALTSKENLRLFSLVCNDLAGVHMELGELDQAAMYLEQARAGLLKLGSDGPLAEALINLALVYYQKGEFDLAMDEVDEALQIVQSAGYPRILATVLMNKAIVERALGAYANSLSSASRALELARQILDQRLIAESTNALGNAYRKLGEPSKAEVLLNQALLEAEDSGQKYITAIYHISLGKVYCQLGSYGPALKCLELAEEQLAQLKSPRRVAEAKLYQAAIFYRTGDLKKAAECLTQVACLTSQIGYDGFLLADGDEVLDILRFGAAKRVGGETFTRLVGRLTPSTLSEPKISGRSFGEGRFPTLRALSFGSPRVVLDTHEVIDSEWRSRKAKELFFFLLCSKQPVSNEEMLETLWPEVSLDLSDSVLKTNIYRLRQALFSECILTRDFGYCINPEVPIEFDMTKFLLELQLAGQHERGSATPEEHLAKAIGLYQGPFLNGFYSDWSQELRTDLELKYHTALMSLASYHASRSHFVQAAELLEKVLAADPYNEGAQYQLIESYLKANEPFLALQQLRKYARVSREELGADLPTYFVDCHRRILRSIPHSLEPVS